MNSYEQRRASILEQKTFEVGKRYKHNTGQEMSVLCKISTKIHGICLLGELDNGSLVPIGMTEDNFVNWKEI